MPKANPSPIEDRSFPTDRCGFVTAAGIRCCLETGHREAHDTDWIFAEKPKPSRGRPLMIWVIHTVWGVYNAPESAIRVYSKKIRKRVFGYTLQMGESAHPALILWPRGDSIWLPMFAIDRIERKFIYV